MTAPFKRALFYTALKDQKEAIAPSIRARNTGASSEARMVWRFLAKNK
jgi:hypothetical protein